MEEAATSESDENMLDDGYCADEESPDINTTGILCLFLHFQVLSNGALIGKPSGRFIWAVSHLNTGISGRSTNCDANESHTN